MTHARFVKAFLCMVVTAALLTPAVHAPAQTTSRQRHFMYMQYSPGNKLIEVSEEGKVLWEHPVPSLAVMFEALPNGNVIYAYGGNPTGVQEVDRNHNVVWDYKAQCEQVLCFERQPNGNIVLGEQGPCQAVEVNRKGKVVRTTPLTTDEKPAHRQLRGIRKLRNGHLLACHEGDGVVREYDENGKVVWDYPGVKSVFDAKRLRNGNTLISTGQNAQIIEVTPERKIVWEFGAKDAPELGLAWITGTQVLRNGNLVASNFLQGKEGTGVHFFEVTCEKKVVWTWADPRSKLVTMAQVLDQPSRSARTASNGIGWDY